MIPSILCVLCTVSILCAHICSHKTQCKPTRSQLQQQCRLYQTAMTMTSPLTSRCMHLQTVSQHLHSAQLPFLGWHHPLPPTSAFCRDQWRSASQLPSTLAQGAISLSHSSQVCLDLAPIMRPPLPSTPLHGFGVKEGGKEGVTFNARHVSCV